MEKKAAVFLLPFPLLSLPDNVVEEEEIDEAAKLNAVLGRSLCQHDRGTSLFILGGELRLALFKFARLEDKGSIRIGSEERQWSVRRPRMISKIPHARSKITSRSTLIPFVL